MAKSAIGLTAAALLTTAAVTITTARTAEQKPDAPPPAPAAAAQAGNAPPVTQAAGSSFEADPNDPEWVAALKKKFETKVTIEFVDTDFESVFAFIRQITNAPIIVLPDAAAHAPAVSINAKDESLAKALQRIIAMAKLEYSFTQGALVVGDAADLKLVQAAKLELSPALAEMLARKVTFEFEDQALSDGINFFGTLTKFKSEIDPAVAQKLVTLRGSKMPLRDAVLWSALLAGAEAADKKGVLVISPATHPIKIPAAGRAAPVVEPKAAPAPERKKDEF